jgi:hypothetical protein
MKALGPDLAVKVNRITLNSRKITVVADSAAWAARLRFRLAECDSELRERLPDVAEYLVRVRPAGAAPRRN